MDLCTPHVLEQFDLLTTDMSSGLKKMLTEHFGEDYLDCEYLKQIRTSKRACFSSINTDAQYRQLAGERTHLRYVRELVSEL